jgi:dolichol-phosphate mannosyltransferase
VDLDASAQADPGRKPARHLGRARVTVWAKAVRSNALLRHELRTHQLQEARALDEWHAVEAGGRSAASHGAPLEPPELAIIVPTLNEGDNLEELLQRLDVTLEGLCWEVIFVDDDSRDGSLEVLQGLMRSRPNVRALRRIGRRGLASACIEGMLATSAPFLAVMDADLQHDEAILPVMLKAVQEGDVDIVVGTRFAPGGSVGDLSQMRLRISRLGRRLSRAISRADLSDPMSGFFVLRRTFFEDTVRQLSGHGFKILLDLFASAPRPVRFVEVPYRFRSRRHGQSKLDTLVTLEFMMLLGDKLLGRYIPVRFIMFVLVGLLGLVVHLTTLGLCFRGIGLSFYVAQVIATLVAMTCNFNLNNLLTYRDRRLRGRGLVYGHLSFYLVCSIGAIANFQIAEKLYELRAPWALAGILGAVVGAVWNYGVSSTFTWRRR